MNPSCEGSGSLYRPQVSSARAEPMHRPDSQKMGSQIDRSSGRPGQSNLEELASPQLLQFSPVEVAGPRPPIDSVWSSHASPPSNTSSHFPWCPNAAKIPSCWSGRSSFPPSSQHTRKIHLDSERAVCIYNKSPPQRPNKRQNVSCKRIRTTI